MKFANKFGPGFASALLYGLATPPFNLAFLVFIALVPWLVSLKELDGKKAWRSGYGFGLLFSLSQLAWILMFVYKWTESPLMAALPWLVASVLMALYFGLAGVLIAKCWRMNIPWAIPFVWAGIEVFRSYIPVLAFPWGLLANPLGLVPMLGQGAFFGGIYLVSAWVAAISTGIAIWLSAEGKELPRSELRGMATLAIAGFALSLLRLSMNTPTERHVVSVIQPGVDLAFSSPEVEQLGLATNVPRLLADATIQGAEGAILPEGIAHKPTDAPPDSPVGPEPPIPILMGGKRGVSPMYQSSFAYEPGKPWQSSDKTRLVIFGEFVPGRDVLPFLKSFNLPSGDLEAAKELKSIDWLGWRWGPILCFEALFPDIAWRHSLNGARSLAVMSIDDWFMGTPAIETLRLASIWRSIETGLPLVRSGALGVTLATDRFGNVITQVPIGKPFAMRVEMDVPTSQQGGIWQGAFPIASFLFTIGLFFWREPRGSQS